MTKAANNRSSIYRDSAGFWHGWVSFGAAPGGYGGDASTSRPRPSGRWPRGSSASNANGTAGTPATVR